MNNVFAWDRTRNLLCKTNMITTTTRKLEKICISNMNIIVCTYLFGRYCRIIFDIWLPSTFLIQMSVDVKKVNTHS